MSKHLYRVVVPLGGYVTVDVEADSPEAAIKASAKELTQRMEDLSAYDTSEYEGEVEHELFLLDGDKIQVTDVDEPDEALNFTLVPMEKFKMAAKGK